MSAKSYGFGVMLQSLLFITVGNIIETSYSPLDKIIKGHFLVDATLVGFLTSIIFIGLALISPFVGFLVDHLGSFRAIKIGFLIMASGATISAISPNYSMFAVGFLAIGSGYGIITPATNSAVMKAYFPYHATPMGIKQSGVPIGASVSAIILPLIFLRFNFYAPFIFLAAISFLFSIFIKGEKVDQKSPVLLRTYLKEIGTTMFNMRFLVTNVLVAVMSWGQQTLLTFAVLYNISLGYTLFTAEGLLAFILIGSLFGRIFWSWISSKIFKEMRIYSLVIVMIFSSLMFFVYAVRIHEIFYSIMISFLIGMTAIGWNGVYITVISETAPKRSIGMYSAMGLLLISIGAIVGTPLSGYIEDLTLNYSVVWDYLGVSILVSSLLLLFFFSRLFRKKNTDS